MPGGGGCAATCVQWQRESVAGALFSVPLQPLGEGEIE